MPTTKASTSVIHICVFGEWGRIEVYQSMSQHKTHIVQSCDKLLLALFLENECIEIQERYITSHGPILASRLVKFVEVTDVGQR